ncbi:hypothetical protein RCL1_003207 [Eukaryota sp. TZLM3-RCL]
MILNSRSIYLPLIGISAYGRVWFVSNHRIHWNSTYLMIEVYIKNIAAVNASIDRSNIKGINTYKLCQDEETDLVCLKDFLQDFYLVTKELSGSSYASAGLYVVFLARLHDKVFQTSQSTRNVTLKHICQLMLSKFQEYEHLLYDFLSYGCAVLDPRIKISNLPTRISTPQFSFALESILDSDYGSAVVESLAAATTPTSSIFHGLAVKRRRQSLTAKEELDLYLLEPLCDLSLDPLKWWAANKSRFPLLSSAARDFLSTQATSVAVERLFSCTGLTTTELRSCLNAESLEALVCLEKWRIEGFVQKID